MVMESSEYSPNQNVFRNDHLAFGFIMPTASSFMDMLVTKYPAEIDMICRSATREWRHYMPRWEDGWTKVTGITNDQS